MDGRTRPGRLDTIIRGWEPQRRAEDGAGVTTTAREASASRLVERALRTGRLRHVFQPIWDLRAGTLIGYEALARFPERCSPAAAWAAARETDTWLQLDLLSARRAVRQARALPGLLFINVSARYLEAREGSIEAMLAAVGAWRSLDGRVVLEVTEDEIGSLAQAAEGVARLRALGVRLALDDVGSGQATPDRLALLTPGLGFVKLDRSVVSAWLRRGDGDFLRWMRWARSRRLHVVAEGVEDRAAADPLLRAGVRGVQGYAFGEPAPAASWTRERLDGLAPPPAAAGCEAPARRTRGGRGSAGRARRDGRGDAPAEAQGGTATPVPAADEIAARWRPLYRDDTWMAVLRDLQGHLRRLTGADRYGLWASLPPHGHWMRLAWASPAMTVACLPPDEEPLAGVRSARRPLACPPAPAGPAFRRIMARLGLDVIHLLPLTLPSPPPAERQFVGVLALGWTAGAPPSPPEEAEMVSVVAYLMAQRVQDTYIEAAMEWIASQPSPSTGAEWLPLLRSLAGWFGGDHWALSGVAQAPGRPPRWECVAENGGFPGIGAAWAEHVNRFADALSAAPGLHSALQGRIDYLGDMADQPDAAPELRQWQQRLCGQGLRSVLTLPLGAGGDGRTGVLVIYWRQPHGWLQAGPSARPWEALRRLMAGWWREMSSASHLLRDPLTGLLNRRGVARAWSEPAHAAGILGILDCDGFHHVNNVWGHLLGDDVLRSLGGVLAEEADFCGGWCGRWGGDEFVVGLPAAVDWRSFGRRLQQRLDAVGRDRGWPQRITLSGGAARWTPPAPPWETALEWADNALYRGKKAGGRRFVVFPLPSALGGRPDPAASPDG
jgi:diguanylate cyclase (GGDEF)-like protein